ncbi:MAG: hypothetical protein AAFN77_03560 [Planctomycetota bacterium]
MKREELESLFQWLVDPHDDILLKGAKSTYVAINGNMFGFISGDAGTLAIRLSKTDRESFLKKHPDSICIEYNTVMKDYVLVPAATLKNKRALRKLFDTCLENARSLKPKPTTRKKKSTKKKAAKKKVAKKTPNRNQASTQSAATKKARKKK